MHSVEEEICECWDLITATKRYRCSAKWVAEGADNDYNLYWHFKESPLRLLYETIQKRLLEALTSSWPYVRRWAQLVFKEKEDAGRRPEGVVEDGLPG